MPHKYLRVPALSESPGAGPTAVNGPPIKGGVTAETTSVGRLDEARAREVAGERLVYVLARRGQEQLETPVFEAGEMGPDEAVAVFTDQSTAVLYLQVAGWDKTHEPAALVPNVLAQYLREAREQGVGHVAVNPDRHDQVRGEPQRTLPLDNQTDRSGEELYRKLVVLGTS